MRTSVSNGKVKKTFCRNFCRMWNYRKIVTQEEQYAINMS